MSVLKRGQASSRSPWRAPAAGAAGRPYALSPRHPAAAARGISSHLFAAAVCDNYVLGKGPTVWA
jgi:hypothetical protein